MIRKILAVLLIIVIAIALVFFVYRHVIIQTVAEKIIRNNLPGYVKADKIRFDFVNNVFSVTGLKILNPPNFSSPYSLAIEEVSCRYALKGVFIPKGFEISDIVIKEPALFVERSGAGRVNLAAMGEFIDSSSRKTDNAVQAAKDRKSPAMPPAGGMKLSDIIKLPQSFDLRDGRLEFRDKTLPGGEYIINIDRINGRVNISFDNDYTGISAVSYELNGNLNGAVNERIKWIANLDAAAPRFTMSNRFQVSDLNLLTFEPYYDGFSPFVFKKGRFSGTLVFDFDSGNIGSTNEVMLSDIIFFVKRSYENAQIWGVSVENVARYFTTMSGDIVFDFKLKGDMNRPTFYLGPISKRAITSMALDKIASYALDQVGEGAGDGGGKVDQYIDLVKTLMKKK